MNRLWWGLALFLSLLTFQLNPLSPPATLNAFAQQSDYLIVPGQRFGKWELGKPLSGYGFGDPTQHFEQKANDIPWNDFYTFVIPPESLDLWVVACKNDSLVFAIMTIREVNRASEATEATRYKTPEGIGIGTEESEVVRLLGQPRNSFNSSERHGNIAVSVRVLDYPGIRIRINQADRRTFALGATTRGGFGACQQAVVGSPTTAQQPAPAPAPALLLDTDYRIVPGQRVGKIELGKPLEAYGLGRPSNQWVREANRVPYYDGYSYSLPTAGTRLQLQLMTCRDDGRVFAVLVWRGVNVSAGAETESYKYKTAEGIGIGTDEDEVLKILGRPQSTDQWTERHGTVEVSVAAHNYAGLRIQVSRVDRNVFAIGATARGAWAGCWQAYIGSLSTSPDPATVTFGSSRVPIPKNVRIVPPGPEVPRARAIFSGKWFGSWIGGLDGSTLTHILIVEEIQVNPPRVIVVYALGPVGRREGVWWRARAAFVGGDLYIDRLDPSWPTTFYHLRDDNTLDASFDAGPYANAVGTMRRMRE